MTCDFFNNFLTFENIKNSMVNAFIKTSVNAWNNLWTKRYFKATFFVTIVIFFATIHYSCYFIAIWENREGIQLNDFILNKIPPKQLSPFIFFIIHSSLVITLLLNTAQPKQLLKALQAYALVLAFRTISIYLLPLEEPTGLIYLQDPITGFFLNSGVVVKKDLFFSGHISAICLFYYYTENKAWKTYLSIAIPVLAILILWQHVHYTIDIIAAPFFTYLGCKLIDKINETWKFGLDKLFP